MSRKRLDKKKWRESVIFFQTSPVFSCLWFYFLIFLYLTYIYIYNEWWIWKIIYTTQSTHDWLSSFPILESDCVFFFAGEHHGPVTTGNYGVFQAALPPPVEKHHIPQEKQGPYMLIFHTLILKCVDCDIIFFLLGHILSYISAPSLKSVYKNTFIWYKALTWYLF